MKTQRIKTFIKNLIYNAVIVLLISAAIMGFFFMGLFGVYIVTGAAMVSKWFLVAMMLACIILTTAMLRYLVRGGKR